MPYVFGYGTLVDRESVGFTLGRAITPEDGPHPVRLHGFRRAWNVAAHSADRPDYTFTWPDGSPWEGWIGFLGIEASEEAVTLGAVYRVSDDELLRLDARERAYERAGVDDHVGIEVDLSDEPVFTYLPKPQVLQDAERVGELTVMARYLRIVDRGYRSLGDELYTEHVATFPDPTELEVAEIAAAVLGSTVPNAIAQPGIETGAPILTTSVG